jgi:hypothetical protein
VKNQIFLLSLVCSLGLIGTGCHNDALVFTTYTKFGLHASATGNTPNNLMFGYKRFEGAIIPVDASKEASEVASVYAAISLTNNWFSGLHLRQAFATGLAAENAATNRLLK